MHRRGDRLPAQGDDDRRSSLPQGVRSIHGDGGLGELYGNGDRLAHRQRHLPDRQHEADNQNSEKNAEHQLPIACLHHSHRKIPSSY